MSDIKQVSEASFESEVLKAEQPVLVNFTAVWCGPCRMLEPVVKELAQSWTGKVKIVKLEVDDSPNLASDYGVMRVPTLMLVKDGEPVQRVSGYQPKDRLVQRFAPYF